MNEQELVQRTYQNFLGDPDRPQIIGIDDIIEAIILAAIGTAVSWLVKRCLNANFDAEKLHKIVRWSLKRAARTPQAMGRGLTADVLYQRYGDRLAAAIVTTRNGLKRQEMVALQQAYPQNHAVNTPEFPSDAD